MAGKKEKRTSVCTLQIQVNYDAEVTDPEGIAGAADILLTTALSTPDILDDYGNPRFGEFVVSVGEENAHDLSGLEEALNLAETLGLHSADLDDTVHDVKSSEASDLNNSGLDGQIEYLVGQLGREAVMQILRESAERKQRP